MTAGYAARPMKERRRKQASAELEDVVGTGALSSEPKSSVMCGAQMTVTQRQGERGRASCGRRSWCRLTVVVDRCCLAARPPRARQSPTGAVVVVEAARWRLSGIRGGRDSRATDQVLPPRGSTRRSRRRCRGLDRSIAVSKGGVVTVVVVDRGLLDREVKREGTGYSQSERETARRKGGRRDGEGRSGERREYGRGCVRRCESSIVVVDISRPQSKEEGVRILGYSGWCEEKRRRRG